MPCVYYHDPKPATILGLISVLPDLVYRALDWKYSHRHCHSLHLWNLPESRTASCAKDNLLFPDADGLNSWKYISPHQINPLCTRRTVSLHQTETQSSRGWMVFAHFAGARKNDRWFTMAMVIQYCAWLPSALNLSVSSLETGNLKRCMTQSHLFIVYNTHPKSLCSTLAFTRYSGVLSRGS